MKRAKQRIAVYKAEAKRFEQGLPDFVRALEDVVRAAPAAAAALEKSSAAILALGAMMVDWIVDRGGSIWMTKTRVTT